MIPVHCLPFLALQVYIGYSLIWPSFFSKTYTSQQNNDTCMYPQHCEPIHRGSYQSEMVSNLASLNSPWRETPLEGHGLESHMGLLKHTLDSKPDMGDETVCFLFLPPQTKSSNPLSPLASLDPLCRKHFPLLGRMLLPLRMSNTKDVGQEDSCPSQLSHFIYSKLKTDRPCSVFQLSKISEK